MAIGKSKLHEMLKRGRLLHDSVVWFEAFDTDLKQTILDWIREDQLRSKGIDADGNVIGYYSLTTSLIDPSKPFNTHYTLDDKGDFFRSMFVTVFKDRIVIDANSDSFTEMKEQDWYTDRILGLTDEHIKKLKEEVKTKYIEIARRILFGGR